MSTDKNRNIVSCRLPSVMCARRNKTKAENKHSESWRSKDILLNHKGKTFLDVYLFTSYVALICTCIDKCNFQLARAVKSFALRVSLID